MPNNLVYCFKTTPSLILSELDSLGCQIEDCSGNWKENQLKIISTNKTCIDDFINDDNYKYEYEYESVCYKECPKRSHQMIQNEFKCEKDPIICPENILFLSVEENLCVQKCDAKNFFE